MKKITLLFFCCVLVSTINAQSVTFSVQAINTSGDDLAIVDMNGDHLDDIVAIQTDNVNVFFQQANGGFVEANLPTPNAINNPSWSLAAADYDRNGHTDLLYGGGSGVTFMKANADGTAFTQITGNEYVFSQRSNFVDINNDGNLDAFVCHDVEPNVFYLNDGTTDATLQFFQGGLGDFPSGGHYGSVWIDYDNDRDIDMFIAKCGGGPERSANQMFENNGDQTYTEVGASIGLRDSMQTWSSAWADFDNDGDMDVFVGASSGSHKLMRNNGDKTFTDITAGSGVELLLDTGIENVPYDLNNDGFVDIVSNGNILIGNGDLTFTEIIGGQLPYSAAFGDLNNDGFIDMNANGNLYINDGNSNNWLTVHTIGTDSNIDGIGARVEIETALGTQIRDVRSGEGFRYMGTMNTHFGIGSDDAIDSVTIYWPSGNVDVIENPTINDNLVVTEGQSLGLEDTLVDSLILYPNPATTTLNLNRSVVLDNAIFTIFDSNGKRISNGKLQSETVNISSLASGSYILRILQGGTIMTQKFIKK